MTNDHRDILIKKIHLKKICFRTPGGYPVTGAMESEADNLASIVLELLSARMSEHQGVIPNFTGTGSVYEVPENLKFIIKTAETSVNEGMDYILSERILTES